MKNTLATVPTTDATPTAPHGAGFVLTVDVDDDAFRNDPAALRELVEAAETLKELADELLPRADTVTTLSLTTPEH